MKLFQLTLVNPSSTRELEEISYKLVDQETWNYIHSAPPPQFTVETPPKHVTANLLSAGVQTTTIPVTPENAESQRADAVLCFLSAESDETMEFFTHEQLQEFIRDNNIEIVDSAEFTITD